MLSRYRRGIAFVGALAITCVAAMGMSSCGTVGEQYNPVQVAAATGKPELVLLALEGSYTIVQGQALAYAQSPSASQEQKNCIAAVAEAADPVVDELRPAAAEVERLRAELLAAGGDEAKAAVVLANLNKAITDAYGVAERVSPQVTALTNAAKGECS